MTKDLELVRSTVLQLEKELEDQKRKHEEETKKLHEEVQKLRGELKKQREVNNKSQLQLTEEVKCKEQMT